MEREPLQFAGCYSLDLYCDRMERHSAQGLASALGCFTGETLQDCLQQARAKGWKINLRDRTARCSRCQQIEKLK